MMESTTLMSPRSTSAPRPLRRRLDELTAGTRAVVQHIESEDAAMQQLKAMGLCVGRHIEVIRQGNPLIIRLLGARVGVSGRLARHIHVESAH
jgi:Fe2+ transport system protein FeoA